MEKYVSISSDGDSDSGIVNQPEGWLTIAPFNSSFSLIDPSYLYFAYVYKYL
jgi:hypothetical protein